MKTTIPDKVSLTTTVRDEHIERTAVVQDSVVKQTTRTKQIVLTTRIITEEVAQ